jgi:hypothetical protein
MYAKQGPVGKRVRAPVVVSAAARGAAVQGWAGALANHRQRRITAGRVVPRGEPVGAGRRDLSPPPARLGRGAGAGQGGGCRAFPEPWSRRAGRERRSGGSCDGDAGGFPRGLPRRPARSPPRRGQAGGGRRPLLPIGSPRGARSAILRVNPPHRLWPGRAARREETLSAIPQLDVGRVSSCPRPRSGAPCLLPAERVQRGLPGGPGAEGWGRR